MKKCYGIPRSEFEQRIARIREEMLKNNLDLLLVYGDEYRREHLRYVSNYWPLFERGILLIPKDAEPILMCAPEGEMIAREMSVWNDIRLHPGLAGIYVPEEIDYPLASYTDFCKLAREINTAGKVRRLGIAGIDSMSLYLLDDIKRSFQVDPIDANPVMRAVKQIKTGEEIRCLKEAGRQADLGFAAVYELGDRLIGMTEIEAAAEAEYAARKAGAEQIVFTILASGDRTESIVGRPQHKVIEDGDMVMCGIAVMYEGYIASSGAPFAVGHCSPGTEEVIRVLMEASEIALRQIGPGHPMNGIVKAVRDYFRSKNMEQYDIYPPLHGIGSAEAESPYPDEHTADSFQAGMTVNTDISLFGMPGGSNRIEEGFLITEDGFESLTPYIRGCIQNYLKGR